MYSLRHLWRGNLNIQNFEGKLLRAGGAHVSVLCLGRAACTPVRPVCPRFDKGIYEQQKAEQINRNSWYENASVRNVKEREAQHNADWQMKLTQRWPLCDLVSICASLLVLLVSVFCIPAYSYHKGNLFTVCEYWCERKQQQRTSFYAAWNVCWTNDGRETRRASKQFKEQPCPSPLWHLLSLLCYFEMLNHTITEYQLWTNILKLNASIQKRRKLYL